MKADIIGKMKGFRDFVDEMLAVWKTPGVAVAVVKDGEVVLGEGFGFRNLEEKLPVTAETLFAIGSCTKAFTAMTMGILVDEGKLDWDKPVRNYLPTFKMHDIFTSERMTPRDLVCHRSGLPRHDWMWYNSPRTRSEIFDRLQYLEPNTDFRSTWNYQNIMFMTAGYLVGQIAGSDWETFTQQRILNPLSMKNTNFSVRTTQETINYAQPYIKKQDDIIKIPFRNCDTIGPTGSINSNVVDMAQWLILNLGKGKYADKTIVSEGNLSQIHAPQMIVPEPLKYKEILYRSYGMGWWIGSYRGHLLIEHDGGADGFSAMTSFMPQENIGVVVLSNLGVFLPNILTIQVYDRLLESDVISWSERFKKDYDEILGAIEKGNAKAIASRKPDTKPSHPLADYVGDFEHPGYGIVSVRLDGDELKISMNEMTFPLPHYHYDIFEMVVDEGFKVSFFTDVKGNIDRLSIPLEPSVNDIVFARVPDKSMKEKSFLQKFVGTYQVMDVDFLIALKGEDILVITWPGQPEGELIPYQGMEFKIKKLSGFSVEFKLDPSGGVISVEIIQPQPYGVYTAQKIK
jgi:CubicO group peptidase (beta-lactamase class C family)